MFIDFQLVMRKFCDRIDKAFRENGYYPALVYLSIKIEPCIMNKDAWQIWVHCTLVDRLNKYLSIFAEQTIELMLIVVWKPLERKKQRRIVTELRFFQ